MQGPSRAANLCEAHPKMQYRPLLASAALLAFGHPGQALISTSTSSRRLCATALVGAPRQQLRGGGGGLKMAATVEHTVGEVVQLPGGITSTDHHFRVPLRWPQLGGSGGGGGGGGSDKRITVFARELVMSRAAKDQSLPWIVFLQGGPGFPSPRTHGPGGWVGRALKDYRVLLLDQRGTGKSTPVTAAGLQRIAAGSSGGSGDGSAAQAEYLSHFRADAIVEDCEAIRALLLAPQPAAAGAASGGAAAGSGGDAAAAAEAAGPRKWTVLGQSYGGFCLATYISRHPEALEAGLFTGGLPPLRPVDDVYSATYKRCAERNRRYYKRYPSDVPKVKAILRHLDAQPGGGVPLPGGGVLTPRRFLQLGLMLGGSSGMESLHYLIDEAWEVPPSAGGGASGELSYSFLRGVENAQSFETNPIYALLHEPIYMCGSGSCGGSGSGGSGKSGASRWSAARVLAAGEGAAGAFDWRGAVAAGDDTPAYFTGEMVYPWMFEGDYALLSPLRGAAEALAARDDWGPLYDRARLREARVPCAAAVYYDDMYVEREFSEELSALMHDCKIWVSNEYQHSGLRDDGVNIFEKLSGMTKGEVNLPS